MAACAPVTSQATPESGEARVVELSVTEDARFTPDRIEVQLGETIRFVLDNPTASNHEMFIGLAEEQDRHHAEHMGVAASDQAAVSHFGYGTFLPAYGDAVIEYTFSQAGEVLIGCHLPGHYEGGHVATVVVSPGSSSSR
jgi:uncharacterized cupredoxin-like copper-binding protein